MDSTLIGTIRSEIKSRKRHLRKLAIDSGVPYSTLVKIGQGSVKNPRIETVERLLNQFGIVCAIPKKCATEVQ